MTDEQYRKAVAFLYCRAGIGDRLPAPKVTEATAKLGKSQQKKRTCNPLNFRSAVMVTTFNRAAGDRTKGVWQFLDTVRHTDVGVKFAELEHSSLRRCLPGRVPILIHPSFTGH